MTAKKHDKWSDEDIASADTAPMVVSPLVRTAGRMSGRRRSRSWSLASLRVSRLTIAQRWMFVLIAFLVPALVVTGSSTLAYAIGFIGSPLAPLSTLLGTWPTDGIDLGCRSTTSSPPFNSVVRSGASLRAAVALTFDDGPSPDNTARMLDTLEQTNTPATFFVMGENVRPYHELLQREAMDGFTIGIHTWDHPYMTQLSPEARARELADSAQAIHNVLGPNYCLQYWRPPYADVNFDVLAQARQMGLTAVTWDIAPVDYESPGVQVIVDRVLSGIHPGAIILLHDGYFGRDQTAQALPQIIVGLRERGFEPVTLQELLTGNRPALPQRPTVTPSPTVVPSPTAIPPRPTVVPSPTVIPSPTVAPSPTATSTPSVSPTPTTAPTATITP